MPSIVIWFFCIGILMFFLSLIFFLISIKYRVNKDSFNGNFEEDREEAEAILTDAKNLLSQLDEYSTKTIENIDQRIEEMKSYFLKFEDYKEQLEKHKNELDAYYNSKQYNFEKFKAEQKFDMNNLLNNSNNSFESITDTEAFAEKKDSYDKNIENPLHKRVMELYENGMRQEDISKNLEIGRNEVKLIINRYVK